MNIAVCDDDLEELKKVNEILKNYKEEKYKDLNVNCFDNGSQFLEAQSSGLIFDVVFFDIMMPGLNGLETARELRLLDRRIKIIFLTSSPDFAFEAYSVQATNYILKPSSKEDIYKQLDNILEETKSEDAEKVTIKTKTGIRTLRADRIEYCEADGHILRWCMADGIVYKSNDSIKEISQKLLNFPDFFRVHRSYIVNMTYIVSIDIKRLEIELADGSYIPVPRQKLTLIQETYLDWCERK